MAAARPHPNQLLLEEANSTANWFHAKKTRPVWARLTDCDQTVETLEGVTQVPAGSFLCRGEAGEVWPQAAEQLNSRYIATDEVDSLGWRRYRPRPDADGVWATSIARSFTVDTAWGKLSGKPGDFLVKNFADKDAPFPADVWIVDQDLFAATYEKV